MILTCPNCNVRYLLDSNILGDEGRRVRCSSCKYIWYQEQDEESHSENKEIDEETEYSSLLDDSNIEEDEEVIEEQEDDIIAEEIDDIFAETESETEVDSEPFEVDFSDREDEEEETASSDLPSDEDDLAENKETETTTASDDSDDSSPDNSFDGDEIPKSLHPDSSSHSLDLDDENRLIPILTGVAVSALVFLVFASILVLFRNNMVSAWPSSTYLYDLAGFETEIPGEGLIFDRVKAETGFDNHGKEVLKIKGRVINLRDESIKVPVVEAHILGSDGHPEKTWKVVIDKLVLAPEEHVFFSSSYPEPGENSGQVRIGFTLDMPSPNDSGKEKEHKEKEHKEHEESADHSSEVQGNHSDASHNTSHH